MSLFLAILTKVHNFKSDFFGLLFKNNTIFVFTEDCLNVMKQELMVMGRDGRPVQRARRRFSVRESNKQIRS